MRSRFLTPSLAFDRAAIMRSAWLRARSLAANAAKAPAGFRRITTARAEFAYALKLVWGEAKSERELALWAAQRDAREAAEAARLNTLSDRDRAVESARTVLLMAEHADRFTAASNAAVAAARAQLAALQPTA